MHAWLVEVYVTGYARYLAYAYAKCGQTDAIAISAWSLQLYLGTKHYHQFRCTHSTRETTVISMQNLQAMAMLPPASNTADVLSLL